MSVVDVIPDTTDLLDRPDLVGALFPIPGDVAEAAASAGLCNCVVPEYAEMLADSRCTGLYCYACELFASAIGAAVVDHTLLMLVDAQGTPALSDRGGWMFADGSDPVAARRSASVAAAIFGIAARGSVHRALEIVSYLVGVRFRIRPKDASALTLQQKSAPTFLGDCVTEAALGSAWLRSVLAVARFFQPPEPCTDAQRLRVATTKAALAAPDGESDGDVRRESLAASSVASCACGVSWLRTQIAVSSKTGYMVMISCVGDALGLEGCGHRHIFLICGKM
jgi:hypothetical protein